MRVVIYGIGKVGIKLAEALYEEDYDVTIIDNDEKGIEQIQKNLDILGIAGHIGNAAVVKNSNIKGADIFIAVTDSDEENIIASIIAKNQNIRRTIARIRNPAYLNKVLLNTSEIGIDYVINPEKEVANEILGLIRTPWASEVDSFINNKVLLVEIKVNPDNVNYINKKLKDISKTGNNIIVVESGGAIKKLHLFEQRQRVQTGEHVFVLEKVTDVSKVNKIFEDAYKEIQNVMIAGGGVTGSELLNLLKDTGIKAKLIEKNRKICTSLSNKFRNSLILYGDSTDLNLLLSENIGKIDCFIAITGDDEENVMASLLAKQHGVKKAITKISKDYEEDIIAGIGLDAAVNLNRVTVNKILQFIRREELLSLSLLDKDVAIIEFNACANSKIVKKTIKEAQFVRGAIIGAIYHDGEIFFPKNDFKVEINDKVLVFVHKKVTHIVDRYFK
jgi:trk system potassium uptake protein TrkA